MGPSLGCLALGLHVTLSQGQDACCPVGICMPGEHCRACLLCVAFVSHARLVFLRHQPTLSLSSLTFSTPSSPSQSSQAQFTWGCQGLIFQTAHMAFLKLAADAAGHKDVTSACVLVTEGHRNLSCLSPNRTPFIPVPLSRSPSPPPAFCAAPI